MTDLEELFRPLIDESAPYREPLAVIEARVRDRRVRRRRQRAQYRFGAAFLAVAVIATAVGVVHARDKTGAPVRPGRVVTTTSPPPTVAAPEGWSSYSYGLARISIPPGWTAGTGCPGPHELVLTDPTNDGPGCGAGGSPSITIAPLPPISAVHRSYVPNATVNGIPYEKVFPRCLSVACGLIVYVPVLEVSLSFSQGVDSNAILKTLTYSTYARLLQQPFGPVPSSWKTVTFNGFSVRVPADWPTVDLSKTEGFCFPSANTVYIGSPRFAAGCAPPIPPVPPPKTSLQLDQDTASELATPSTAPESLQWHHSGLTLTRQADLASTPIATDLFLDVDGPHGRLLVTLGLGPDPAVARAILGSLEPTAS